MRLRSPFDAPYFGLQDAGWSSLVARQAHNLKAAGSNPAPATPFAPPEKWRSTAFTYCKTQREDFMSVSPVTLIEDSQGIMLEIQNGQKEKGRGRPPGKANRCPSVLHANWRIVLSVRAAGLDSMRSPAFRARQAHNPAAAGPRVQIPPPQPNYLPRAAACANCDAALRGESFQSSSVVERSAVNRLVVGSNPTSGAKFLERLTTRGFSAAGIVAVRM
ncbi:MAG: hypothetical protein QOI07_1292 [Verrucomicrobiota bacterium]